jgi:N6-adenosine-specific RNA methylase IME4
MPDEIDIAAIRVEERHRKDLGDIPGLAASIVEVTLLHPIVVTPDMRLIAGERRLAAYQHLGRTRIPVTVVNLDDVVRGEFVENSQRKDFAPSEIDAIRRAVEPLEKAAAQARMTLGQTAQGSDKGRVRDKVGAFAGVSGRKVAQIAAVIDAAEVDPERFGKLVEEMDRTGRVESPYRQLRKARDEDRVLGLAPIAGRFRTLVFDPPWKFPHEGSRGTPYHNMTQEELLTLTPQVQAWSEDNAHLYLWTTDIHWEDARALMRAWGFAFMHTLTWVKPSFTLGHFFRHQTEPVLFGVKGHLPTRPAAQSIADVFYGKPSSDTHSAKPDSFYDIVRRASYPPFGEAFQVTARPDFVNLYRRKDAALAGTMIEPSEAVAS